MRRGTGADALQSLEPRYNRKAIFHLTVGGVNQCTDLEEELLRHIAATSLPASRLYIESKRPFPGGNRSSDRARTRLD